VFLLDRQGARKRGRTYGIIYFDSDTAGFSFMHEIMFITGEKKPG